jgi:hypothetical protein
VHIFRNAPGSSNASGTQAYTGADEAFTADLSPGAYSYEADPGEINTTPDLAGPGTVPGPAGHLFYLNRWYHSVSDAACIGRCVTIYFNGSPKNFPSSDLLLRYAAWRR